MIEAPVSITYASVVSHDIVRVAFTIADIHDL